MELIGQVGDIIFQNEVNSYTIATFETEEELYTIVGYLPFINEGDSLKLDGKIVVHQEYGEQFKVETFEKIMPQTLDALEKYLANGVIKGIGPATAKKIIKTFGEETISIFKQEPEKLAQIKGISKEKAIEMGESFTENWEIWQIVGFLEKFGIGAASAKKVQKELGNNAIEKIEQNPYILIDLARGIDFKQIDKMALDLGLGLANEKRIIAGIKHGLLISSINGHTCVLKDNLLNFVEDLLGLDKEIIENIFINLKANNDIIIEKQGKLEWVYLEPFYIAEKNIAERIFLLQNSQNIKKIKSIEKELKIIEKTTDIELSEKQKEAVLAINENNVCIITGGPGTGKTTVIKSIIELYKKQNKKVVLCAPTGRAAKRMTETTGEDACTLHRLLEIGKTKEESRWENVNENVAPIDADVIIVDEMSMVDLFLMNLLMKGIYQGTKLILVGDVDQLPSVGPGNVLADLINSEEVMTVRLDKIFRQAAKSKIILNAHRVNNGEAFLSKDETKGVIEDFFYLNEKNTDKIFYHVLTLCKDRLKNYGDYEFFRNIQVISPTKKGNLGTKELNKALQEALNPSSEYKKEKSYSGVIFREGDKVMQIKNNYDIFWERKSPEYENGTGVFNGELGIIQTIDEKEKQLKIKFDDEKEAWYLFQDLEQIEHAYAITVHKAQGSEFDVVVMPITASSPMLLTRNLLYTALTRAKKLLIVIGPANIIDFMIGNFESKKRNTGLEYKIKNIF